VKTSNAIELPEGTYQDTKINIRNSRTYLSLQNEVHQITTPKCIKHQENGDYIAIVSIQHNDKKGSLSIIITSNIKDIDPLVGTTWEDADHRKVTITAVHTLGGNQVISYGENSFQSIEDFKTIFTKIEDEWYTKLPVQGGLVRFKEGTIFHVEYYEKESGEFFITHTQFSMPAKECTPVGLEDIQHLLTKGL
jgi:hypothetical protein